MQQRPILIIGLLIYLSAHNPINSLRASSKLDFEDSKLVQPIISNPVQYKNFKRENTVLTIDNNRTVICGFGGCNRTDSVRNIPKETIKTDVIVHVQTDVDLEKQNESPVEDEIPDVPVVIGYSGSNLDKTKHEFANNPLTFNEPNKALFQPSISNNYSPNYQVYNRESGIYSTNTGSISREFYNYPFENNRRLPSTDISKSLEQFPEIKSQTLPAVSITMKAHVQPNNIRYNNRNRLETYIPYFEPSYNNHYFGESPPPSVLWYPKRNSHTNPVAFNNIPKITWNPSLWTNKVPSLFVYKTNGMNTKNNCDCHNLQSPNRNTKPYYNSRGFDEDPGSRIDDKLGPLN